MITQLTQYVIRRRTRVLAVAGLLVVIAGIFGGNVASHLTSGGFDDPGSESAKTKEVLTHQFGSNTPNLVLLVKTPGSISSTSSLAAGRALERKLAHEKQVTRVTGYFDTRSPAFLGRDGKQAIVLALIGGGADAVNTRVSQLSKTYTSTNPQFAVGVGGFSAIFQQVNTTIRKDLARAEAIAIPITFLALVVVFGGLVAASLPLVIGLTSILGTFLVLRILTLFTSVSIFSLNMTTAMGLGLGIDYALFIVSRYREELRAGKDMEAALERTMQTAGRTIVFSSLTVALALSALLVFPIAFLRSFAYAGVAVVLIAMLGALVVLPAFLAVLGPKVDSLVLWRRARKDVADGFWHRLAITVMKRPVIIGGTVTVLLLVLGSPFFGVNFGLPDDRVLPAAASSHIVTQDIRTNFGESDNSALTLVAQGVPSPLHDPTARTEVAKYALALSRVPDTRRVIASTGIYSHGRQVARPSPQLARYASRAGITIDVIPSVESYSHAGEHLVGQIRAVAAPFKVGLTGQAAELVDVERSIFHRVPLAFAIIAITSFALLFLLTGSVVVPLKALTLNLLSLSAVFGSMVFIFQQGHFGSLLGHFQTTGFLDTTTPILLFCVAFGLSMDYEVFLLSRIKEEYDISGDTRSAVALGLERTGGIVTSAAALFSIVNLSFVSSGITFIKLFGLGLTIAVMVDATLVRGMLVPSFMRLMGQRNWWAPPWAKAFHNRLGISDSAVEPAAA